MKKTKKIVKKTSKIRMPVRKPRVQSPKSKVSSDIHLTGVPMVVEKTSPAMVIQWPRTIVHHHTYGLLSPFFEGLKKGVLRGVRCPNPHCEEKGIWLPPRADCPDCHTRMKWVDLKNPSSAKSSRSRTSSIRATASRSPTRTYQIDVRIPAAGTVMKGYLTRARPKIA